VHDLVGFQIDDVKKACAEMCGKKITVVVVDGEIVKALSRRAGQIDVASGL